MPLHRSALTKRHSFLFLKFKVESNCFKFHLVFSPFLLKKKTEKALILTMTLTFTYCSQIQRSMHYWICFKYFSCYLTGQTNEFTNNSQINLQSPQLTINKTHHKKWMFTSNLVTVKASHKRSVNKTIYIKIYYNYKIS